MTEGSDMFLLIQSVWPDQYSGEMIERFDSVEDALEWAEEREIQPKDICLIEGRELTVVAEKTVTKLRVGR